jgi:hypothetical protein
LLVGRENLEDDEIENNKNDIEIANYEKFFFNYADRCAVWLYFANLIINRVTTEIANIY